MKLVVEPGMFLSPRASWHANLVLSDNLIELPFNTPWFVVSCNEHQTIILVEMNLVRLSTSVVRVVAHTSRAMSLMALLK
jgi:hypothetical protein